MALSGLLGIVIVLVVIGVCLYLLENYVPMAAPIKTVIRVIVVLALIVWLLQKFGLVSGRLF